MKRYVCTVATGLLLALVSTGTATASGPARSSGQTGDAEDRLRRPDGRRAANDADVTQKQGNGNVNIAPAIAIFGDAETTNEQGNGNTATANVDQSNSVDQSQSSTQKQSLEQSGTGCCDGQSQTGEQKSYGGDQTVDKQKNDADVDQKQGNGNMNISPAIAIFGDAETDELPGQRQRRRRRRRPVERRRPVAVVDAEAVRSPRTAAAAASRRCKRRCAPKKDYG